MINKSGRIIRMRPVDSDANSARFSPSGKPDNHPGGHQPGGHHLPLRAVDQQQRTAQQQRCANPKEIA